MSAIAIGIIGIVVFLVFLALKMPLGLAMAMIGFTGFSLVVTPRGAYRMLSSELVTTFTSYSLSVIPMFIFMGFIAYYAGVGTKLYSFAYKLIGRLPGGLAMASQVACAIFGAVCGSSTATTATIGSIAIPEMQKYKYSNSLATGCVAAGGALGVLIPPSIIFVIYGIAVEQSVAKLFLAGLLPGILLTLLYIMAIWIITRKNPELGPPAQGPAPGLKEIYASLGSGIFQVVIVFVLSLGGLFAGWFTPTEAGGVGAAGMLLVTLASRDLTWEGFNNALADTTRTVAMILLLVAGAVIFSRFIAISRIPFVLADWVSGLPLPPFLVMGIILLIYLLLGTFIEAIPLILLTIPIFYPVVIGTLGYDPIWFGVMIVMIVAMGVITPPVGINVYIVKGIAKNVPLETIFQGIWPFLLAVIVCSALLIIFPQIALFLPDLINK